MSKGFISDPLSFISQITENLNDRYIKGFPIVKELIQNADDAHATCLHIGWSPCFPAIDHPLLQGPTLFVVNDGEFKKKDARAIRHFGISYKASEHSSIGKFGLGLKSIFHLCEAFFYFGSESETIELLNPWSSSDDDNLNFHVDWNEIEHISSSVLKSIFSDWEDLFSSNHWFCLLIPLRQKRHLDGCSPIINDFPGDNNSAPPSIFSKDLLLQISKLLPLLRSLETVKIWEVNNQTLTKVCDVNVVKPALRLRYSAINNGDILPLAGKISLGSSADNDHTFGGIESFRRNGRFQSLQDLNLWPKSQVRNPDTGRPEIQPDKAYPHCAAYFIETPTQSSGFLSIRWAVFLPIGEKPFEQVQCEKDSDFTLTLHGYFFLDAGRSSDIGFGDGRELKMIEDEDSLRKEWNHEIKHSGILPLILPALKRFVDTADLSKEKIKALTASLEKSDLFRNDKVSICKQNQWVYRLAKSGMEWKLLDSTDEIFEIPEPPISDRNRPLEVFPKLKKLSEDYVITYQNFPCLIQSRPVKWEGNLLDQLLSNISVEDIFTRNTYLKYFVELLKNCVSRKGQTSISERLFKIARKAFQSVHLSQLSKYRTQVKKFLRLLPQKNYFVIKEPTDLQMEALLELDLNVLPIPRSFEPQERDHRQQQLPTEDAIKILEFLANPPSEFGETAKIIKEVIQASDWGNIVKSCDDLKLFKAYDVQPGKEIFFSFNELKQIRETKTLFAYSTPPNKFGLAKPLQSALTNERVVLIARDIEGTIFEKNKTDHCDLKNCFEVLSRKPPLNPPDVRTELLKSLVQSKDAKQHENEIRYLIHGRKDDDNSPLLVDRRETSHSVWSKICRQALRRIDAEWRLISPNLADKVAGEHWLYLSITEIDSSSVEKLIWNVGPERIDCTTLNADERDALLEQSKDFKLLIRLNIHQTIDGDFVRITNRTYWEGGFELPEDLLKEFVILKRSSDDHLSNIQSRLLSCSLDAKSVISIILQQAKPYLYWESIMSAVQKIDEDSDSLPSDLIEDLKRSDWLPVDDGKSPNDLIYLKGLEDEITRMMSSLKSLPFINVSQLPQDFHAHKAFEAMAKQIIPPRESALKMLFKVLSRTPQLDPPDQRTELLQLLVRSHDAKQHKNEIRYLIHGRKYDDNSPLLVDRRETSHSVWSKICRQALRRIDAEWRLISPNLADKVAGEDWRYLSITEIDSSSVEKLILKVGPKQIDCTTLNADERNTLLKQLNLNNNFGLLKCLNIHQTIDGDFVRITGRTYWEGNFDLPEELLHEFVILKQSSDPRLSDIQSRLLPRSLDAKSVISIILRQAKPYLYWESIMSAVQKIDEDSDSLPSDLIEKLKKSDWLPVDDGRLPNDLIYLKGLEDEVARVLSSLDNPSSIGVLKLPQDFREHGAFEIFANQIVPPPEDALKMLGAIMSNNSKYFIGQVLPDDFDLEKFLFAFDQVEPQFMPAKSLIHGVKEKVSTDACEQYLLPKLQGSIPTCRIIDILKFLSNQHETASSKNKAKKFLEVHNWYLEDAVKKSDFSNEILPEIRLLSRKENWKSPKKLCFEAHQIIDDDLLDKVQLKKVQGKIIGRQKTKKQRSTNPQPSLSGAERLEEYFEPWRGMVPDAVIGGFLCLLGNKPKEIQKLAINYLDRDGRDIDVIRSRFDWKRTIMREKKYSSSHPIKGDMDHYKFIVEVRDRDTVLTSLTGDEFKAHIISKGFEDLIIGNIEKIDSWSHGYEVQLKLRKINPKSFSEKELSDLLQESVRVLLRNVYSQSAKNLNELWEDLTNSSQFNIQVAQSLMLDHSFFYIQQLGINKKNDKIKEFLTDWNKTRIRMAEERQIGEERYCEEDFRDLLKKWKVILEDNREVQSIIYQSVCKKIEQYQYNPKSVPFELFQNADDAVVEWVEMVGEEELEQDANRFVVLYNEAEISFAHWGRPINRFTDDKNREYALDLERMLALNASHKSLSEEKTGKFGLGFKTVFLVTEKPRVISERLCFEVVGGLFPRQLTGDDEKFKSLSEIRDSCSTDSTGKKIGTVINLPFKEDISQDDVLSEFQRLAPILLIFAKRIRQLELSGKEVHWADRLLTGTKSVYIGQLKAMNSQDRPLTAIVLRAGEGDLLLVLDSRKFSRFPKEVPTFWVTAPTKEKLELGFAINGQFDLDTGRAQLARESEKNSKLANSIGSKIGDSLIEFFDASADWNQFCYELNLATDTKKYDFWESLWNLLGVWFQKKKTGATEPILLIDQILWQKQSNGYAKLLCDRPALPTELWGDYKTLIRSDHIGTRAVGTIDTEDIFSVISKWETFQENVKIGEMVSETRTYSIFRKLLPDLEHDCKKITLSEILRWELESSRNVDAIKSSRLGEVINSELLSDLRNGNNDQKAEYQELIELFREVRFRGRDGKFHLANELLIASDSADNPDEPKRASFAPNDRILDESYYGDPALSFFKVCREKLTAPDKLIAEWAMRAKDDEKRYCVLKYLLEGERGRELAQLLKSTIKIAWSIDLSRSNLLNRFDLHEQGIILGLLQIRRFEQREEPEPDFKPPPRISKPKRCLENIYEWWMDEKEERIREYERDIYGNFELNLSNEPDWNDIQDRTNWLTLFIYGSLHTMGRTQPRQHRGFLRECREKGWLQEFANPNPDHSRWINVLEQYLNSPRERIKFFQWMQQFVSIFQFANWLQDYGDAFLEIEKLSKTFRLDLITRPRYSYLFQGGGVNAPSIDRTLGIGVCFVVRELLRKGVIKNHNAYEHCYVPVERVRDILSKIGCNGLEGQTEDRWERSRKIYKFLREYLGDKATFNLSFDLPFLIIAEHSELEDRLVK